MLLKPSNRQIIQSNLIKNIILMPKDMRLPYFERHCHLIEDDNCYWQVLGTIWMDAPKTTLHIERWRKLFEAKRRNRHKLMKKSDRNLWRKLPEKVHCFRATNPEEVIEKAISWTINKEIAVFFQNRNKGSIIERVFNKGRILAFFDRRGEQEVIVL